MVSLHNHSNEARESPSANSHTTYPMRSRRDNHQLILLPCCWNIQCCDYNCTLWSSSCSHILVLPLTQQNQSCDHAFVFLKYLKPGKAYNWQEIHFLNISMYVIMDHSSTIHAPIIPTSCHACLTNRAETNNAPCILGLQPRDQNTWSVAEKLTGEGCYHHCVVPQLHYYGNLDYFTTWTTCHRKYYS